MRFLTTLILLLSVMTVKCQLIDSCLLNFEWNVTTNKDFGHYIKETYKTNDGYKVLIFKNPKIKKWDIKTKVQILECNYKSLNPEVEDGFFQNERMKGYMNNGEMVGLWYVFDGNGIITDTLDYSFSIINHKYTNNVTNVVSNITIDFDPTNIVYMDYPKYMHVPPIEVTKKNYCKINFNVKTNDNGDITEITFEDAESVNFEKEVIRVLLKHFPKYKNFDMKLSTSFRIM